MDTMIDPVLFGLLRTAGVKSVVSLPTASARLKGTIFHRSTDNTFWNVAAGGLTWESAAAKARAAFAGVTAITPAMGRSDPIEAVDQGGKTFTIHRPLDNWEQAGGAVGATLFVDGSTGNDSLSYTVASYTAYEDGGVDKIDIEVAETIPDGTADGNLIVPLDLTGCTTGRQYSMEMIGNVYGVLADCAAGEVFGVVVDNSEGYTFAPLGLSAGANGGLGAIAEAVVDVTVYSYDGSTQHAIAVEVPE